MTAPPPYSPYAAAAPPGQGNYPTEQSASQGQYAPEPLVPGYGQHPHSQMQNGYPPGQYGLPPPNGYYGPSDQYHVPPNGYYGPQNEPPPNGAVYGQYPGYPTNTGQTVIYGQPQTVYVRDPEAERRARERQQQEDCCLAAMCGACICCCLMDG